MPPIVVLALGALAAGALIHRAVKEMRRINSELDRVKEGRAMTATACLKKRRRPKLRVDGLSFAAQPRSSHCAANDVIGT
jgi:hypothetical protein